MSFIAVASHTKNDGEERKIPKYKTKIPYQIKWFGSNIQNICFPPIKMTKSMIMFPNVCVPYAILTYIFLYAILFFGSYRLKCLYVNVSVFMVSTSSIRWVSSFNWQLAKSIDSSSTICHRSAFMRCSDRFPNDCKIADGSIIFSTFICLPLFSFAINRRNVCLNKI